MHFEATGLPLPKEGGIVVRAFSKIQAIERKIPNSFVKIFSAPKTLRQGSWDVAAQNIFTWGIVEQEGAIISQCRAALHLVTNTDQSVEKGDLELVRCNHPYHIRRSHSSP